MKMTFFAILMPILGSLAFAGTLEEQFADCLKAGGIFSGPSGSVEAIRAVVTASRAENGLSVLRGGTPLEVVAVAEVPHQSRWRIQRVVRFQKASNEVYRAHQTDVGEVAYDDPQTVVSEITLKPVGILLPSSDPTKIPVGIYVPKINSWSFTDSKGQKRFRTILILQGQANYELTRDVKPKIEKPSLLGRLFKAKVEAVGVKDTENVDQLKPLMETFGGMIHAASTFKTLISLIVQNTRQADPEEFVGYMSNNAEPTMGWISGPSGELGVAINFNQQYLPEQAALAIRYFIAYGQLEWPEKVASSRMAAALFPMMVKPARGTDISSRLKLQRPKPDKGDESETDSVTSGLPLSPFY